MKTFATLLFLSLCPLFGAFPPSVSSSVLYSMYQGNSEKALTTYLDYAKKTDSQDYELLQEAAIRLLERGMKSPEREDQLMCMFGAGISTNAALIPVLQKGLENKEPKIQITALHYLAKLNDDLADLAIEDCLSSPNLLLRLETALILAEKNDPEIVEQMESLYFKVNPKIRPVFAEIIAGVRTVNAAKFLEKLMCDEERDVRLYTIIEAGRNKRDDLLPRLQKQATMPDNATQEAAVSALCELQDSSSKALFIQVCKKKSLPLKLIAWKALHQIGEEEFLQPIEQEALQKNLFALPLYAELATSESSTEHLLKFLEAEEFDVRFNAALALLKRGDARSWPTLKPFLFQKERQILVTQQFSPGRALSYWSQTHATEKSEMLTLQLREKILRQTLELPEEDFLKIARAIFDTQQIDLVAPLIELLVNHDSEKSIELLQFMQQKTGAPFIRNYCNLALYRLKIPGPYEANLLSFINDAKSHPLIRLREKKESDDELEHSSYSLNPEERSQLLITSFETLASEQNNLAIEALINAIAHGHPQNKYALAGLLIRSAE